MRLNSCGSAASFRVSEWLFGRLSRIQLPISLHFSFFSNLGSSSTLFRVPPSSSTCLLTSSYHHLTALELSFCSFLSAGCWLLFRNVVSWNDPTLCARAQPRAPALPWRSDAFFAVDDRVRGGTSHSHMAIVQYPPVSRGEIIFSGFLDTTTLGGAGFASQSSSVPFPVTLSKDDFQGFRIVVRKETNWSEPTPPPSDGSNPGGGKGPVTSFVFQIKTEEPERRPDGRRESVIVWEWSFTIPPSGDDDENDGERCPSLNIALSNDDFWVFDSTWTDFKPFYRGRPVDPDTAGNFTLKKHTNGASCP